MRCRKYFPASLFQRFRPDLVIRIAPNGDIFVAETAAGQVSVFRLQAGSDRPTRKIFASGINEPFGIAFYPPGPEPRWVYVASPDHVVRYPYKPGDMTAAGASETIVKSLPAGGHSTRDLAFSPDGKTLFVSVGSGSNVAEDIGNLRGADLATFVEANALGAAWGSEKRRADVIAFDPEGGNSRIFATGLRNCSGLTVQPATGALWCAVNERDLLGDDLPPDYATHVEQGAFFGWPWYYIGGHADPRLTGARPDLAGKVTVPDVLIQPHSAPLGITFYEGARFPPAYKGSAFVTLHGSWNRAKRTGYKVVRLPFRDGRATGEYEDFVTGFVTDGANVWGRPVGVAVAKDGALLITDDESNTLWRVTYGGKGR